MSVAIPYNNEPRPDTGLYNAKLGIWLFLASEVMLFGALFTSYIAIRVGSPTWPAGEDVGLNIWLAAINTFVLIASSVTMVMSWASLMENRIDKFNVYMTLTILCGVIFMVIKAFEYGAKFSHGVYPSTSTFFALYFTLTGLHGLHVVGGVIVNFYILASAPWMFQIERQRLTNRVECAGLYWHFVDLVWIFLFPTLYLMPGKH
jgi:heme/copper-type cytochrome/quinol oxidase subunit 3